MIAPGATLGLLGGGQLGRMFTVAARTLASHGFSQRDMGKLLGLEERPNERATRALAEAWRPHRGAAAIFAWHHYGANGKSAAPV